MVAFGLWFVGLCGFAGRAYDLAGYIPVGQFCYEPIARRDLVSRAEDFTFEPSRYAKAAFKDVFIAHRLQLSLGGG